MFGPDKNLYVSLGDGGAANDVADGHTPGTGNGQDTSNVLGTLLRINPDGNNSVNGQYGVPADNPFVGGGGVAEIYADGFRNPFRFSFDSATGDLIVADVGQNHIEEIDQVVSGGNYGWHVKEGTFLFDPNTGDVTADSPGLPAGLLDPVAQYDHDEGIAIVGGFVYHGTAIPELIGKYVFGDFSLGFGAPGGRLFYADLATGLIQELTIGLDDRRWAYLLRVSARTKTASCMCWPARRSVRRGRRASCCDCRPCPSRPRGCCWCWDPSPWFSPNGSDDEATTKVRARTERAGRTIYLSVFSKQLRDSIMRLRPTIVMLAFLTVASGAQQAQATFHLWQIQQLYSNASGSVQYIDLVLPLTFDDESHLSGHSLTAGLNANSLVFQRRSAGAAGHGPALSGGHGRVRGGRGCNARLHVPRGAVLRPGG